MIMLRQHAVFAELRRDYETHTDRITNAANRIDPYGYPFGEKAHSAPPICVRTPTERCQ